MARKRVAPFDPPTQAEADLHPDQVLKAPRGGWMWKCADCGRPAVYQSVAGRKVCRKHGGTTAAQRDPVKIQEAAERGEVLRGPGRPVKHGLYSRRPGYKVDELVDQLLADGIDPDDTAEDMLFLRAYLDELRPLRPDLVEIHTGLTQLAETMNAALQVELDSEGMTVERYLLATEMLELVCFRIAAVDKFATKALRFAKQIEDRHAKLVLLSKVRADTRLKNAAASQLTVFKVMLERLEKINAETLPPNQAEALSLRYARELSEVPAQAVKGVKA